MERYLASILIFLFVSIGMAYGTPLHLQYATHFQIESIAGGCKLVTDGAGRRLLLVPRGKRPPKGYRCSEVIEIPVKRVVTKWTTIPPLLKAIGVVGSIVGVTTRQKNWYIKEIRQGMKQGRIKYLGQARATDYERLRSLDPDIFFAGEWDRVELLKELKIPFAMVTEYLEKDPLGRLEWIKFFAAFYNREMVAERFFNNAVKNVNALSLKISKIETRPKVLWGFISAKGTVYVPRGDSYVARMISMAGGDYVFKHIRGVGSVPISLEEFYSRGRDADIYISTGILPQYGITSIKKLLVAHPILKGFKAVNAENIWCLQPWYWESIDKTDEIIEDLAAIFHPKLFPGHRPRYFLRLQRL